MGLTTQEVIKSLDATLFTRNFTSTILAHEDDAIAKIFNIPRFAYQNMPEPLRPDIDRGGGSKYEMFFPKLRSRIYCDLESRGDTINWLHVSETAFMDKDRLNATLQAVPLNGTVTLETTANGLDNFFCEMWFDENSPYEKIFLPWFLHDEYQLPVEGKFNPTTEEKEFKKKVKSQFKLEITNEQIMFRRFKQAELKEMFIQEYPEDDISCFIHTGRTVCDQALFTRFIKEASPIIDLIEDIEIYHRKDVKKNYVIGADVSQGIGGDYSTASVICIEDREEVAFFRGQLSPYLFAKKLDALASLFTSGSRLPLLAVEQNNHGHATLQELRENIKYPRLYFRQKPNGERAEDPGWVTNSLTRPLLLDQYIELVSSEFVKLNSEKGLKEARMLIEDKGKIQAPPGKHDDCVFAQAIAIEMLHDKTSRIGLYQTVSRDILV